MCERHDNIIGCTEEEPKQWPSDAYGPWFWYRFCVTNNSLWLYTWQAVGLYLTTKLMFKLALLCAVGAENLRVFLNIIAQFTVV